MSVMELSPVGALPVDEPCRMFPVAPSAGDLLEQLVSWALRSKAKAEVGAARLSRGARELAGRLA